MKCFTPFFVGLILLLTTLRTYAQEPIPDARCAPAAFLTLEHGRLAGVDWVEYRSGKARSYAVLNQSLIVDATIDLHADQTASHASVAVFTAGSRPRHPTVNDLGDGAIYWSPMLVSSVEQAIARARALGQVAATIPGASLFSASRVELVVKRLDATDWTIDYQDKHYEVLTDEQGCMVSAALPDFGVIIERRTGFARTQYPLWSPYGAPPDHAYQALDVSIPAPRGHVLAGTLTLPAGRTNVPAALMITGLSPHERNNGSAPWMPFRDFADALTRAGIAVLRVDDRGEGQSTGNHASMTLEDKVDDVRTEVKWLRARKGIDATRIALIGYSEGGLIAPMVASSDRAISAIVTLAGPGVPGRQVARYQVALPILRDPTVPAADKSQEIDRKLAESLKGLSPHEQTYLATQPQKYDRQVLCPALVIQGGSDADVPVRSAERIAAAMRVAGNRDVTVRIFPGVSHSLLPDPNGLATGWAWLPGFITTPELLDQVTHWVVARLSLPGPIVGARTAAPARGAGPRSAAHRAAAMRAPVALPSRNARIPFTQT